MVQRLIGARGRLGSRSGYFTDTTRRKNSRRPFFMRIFHARRLRLATGGTVHIFMRRCYSQHRDSSVKKRDCDVLTGAYAALHAPTLTTRSATRGATRPPALTPPGCEPILTLF